MVEAWQNTSVDPAQRPPARTVESSLTHDIDGDAMNDTAANTLVPGPTYKPWLNRFAVVTALSTLFLIFAGGMVTSTGSGLSVPDWPLSYGMLMPPMVGGVFYEHGHRMIATGVGFLMTIQAIWIFMKAERPWLKKLAGLAWLLVVIQGVLGGMTVLYKLPPWISVLHACTAQTFFCLTIAMAVFTSKAWLSGSHRIEGEGEAGDGLRVKPLVILGVAALFLQLILGAIMRHKGAGLAVLNFPLLSAQGFPELNFYTGIHLAHRYWAVVVASILLFTAGRILWTRGFAGRLSLLALMMIGTVVTQATLGVFTVLTFKGPIITSLHVATGAALLGVTILTTLFSFRTEPALLPLKATSPSSGVPHSMPAMEAP